MSSGIGTLDAPLVLSEAQQRFWMNLLLRRAEAIGRQGEVPVSALVLDGHGRCIGFGRNTRETI